MALLLARLSFPLSLLRETRELISYNFAHCLFVGPLGVCLVLLLPPTGLQAPGFTWRSQRGLSGAWRRECKVLNAGRVLERTAIFWLWSVTWQNLETGLSGAISVAEFGSGWARHCSKCTESKGTQCPLKQELQNTNAVLLLAGKPTGRMCFPPFPLSVGFSTG